MRPAEDSDDGGAKRDPRDFALWKAAKPGEPYWETPWGPGRPGWHLECSAMSTKYLGPSFDIHCGGIDLIFPHHENEIAQSVAAGDGFARYWLHNGLLGLAGEKMSKSGGNSLLVTDVLTRVRPAELRYYLVQAHYRSLLDFSEDALDEAAAAYQRIERFVMRASEALGRLGIDYGSGSGSGSGGGGRPGRTTSGPGCRCHFVRPWTRTSACRPPWQLCTHVSGTATRRWPPPTRPAPALAWSGSGPCSGCSASIRSPRPGRGPRAALATGCARWSGRWSN